MTPVITIPRETVILDHDKHRLTLAIKDGLAAAIEDGADKKYGVVAGPLNILHDYTQDDMERMREAGRKYGLEQERKLMNIVLGEDVETDKERVRENQIPDVQIPLDKGNRKRRRALKAEARKKLKLLAKAGKLFKSKS